MALFLETFNLVLFALVVSVSARIPQVRPVACWDKNGRTYQIGEAVDTGNPCEKCTCGLLGSIDCAVIDCLRCRGEVVPVKGQCCGECYINDIQVKPGSGCKKEETLYKIGDHIPTEDPCEECTCADNDVMCAIMDCLPCDGIHVPVEGSCCGKCLGLTTEPALGSCEVDGRWYTIGEAVETGDPCEKCTCGVHGSIDCAEEECLPCRGEIVPVKGQCCGDCFIKDIQVKPGSGCRKEETLYKIGDHIPTRDPCEDCMCADNDVMCAVMACMPCVGIHVPVEGTCCGECRDVTIEPVLGSCEMNGIRYKTGDDIPTENPCKHCTCEDNDVMCSEMACLPCIGMHVPVEGSCCGECREIITLPVIGCVVDGNRYRNGDQVPTRNPCEICFCDDTEVTCSMVTCPPCSGLRKPVRGQCCGECIEVSTRPPLGCEMNGNHYEVGPFVDPNDKCSSCECQDDGRVSCEKKVCPALACKKSRIVQSENQCCPVCSCVYNKRPYMPGPIDGRCESLLCIDGKVKLRLSPNCPKRELTCVDPQLGPDCCLHCPQGTTCRVGKKTIRAGEFRNMGKQICTCLEGPWFPNAFCSLKKVNWSFKKMYGPYLAPNDLVGI